MARQVVNLRARIDYLARSDSPQAGWQFPGEATSYGLARVRVMLSQLAKLTSSGFPMLVREEEIKQQRRDAEQRLLGLESLQATRLLVQPIADDRPAAQRSLGQLLRRATDLLGRPTFDQTQQTDLANLLQVIAAWLAPETREEKYRGALIDSRRSDELPDPGMVAGLVAGPVRTALEALLADQFPGEADITNATSLDVLKDCDQKIAKLVLLWRERESAWAEPLAKDCAGGKALGELFRIVDEGLWESLVIAEKSAGQLQIVRASTTQENLETYDLTEIRLTSNDGDFDNCIIHHPMRVRWRIVPPEGNVRVAESDGLILVQYFPSFGKVKVQSFLRWKGREIPVKQELSLEVVANPDYGKSKLFGGGFTEWIVLAIAAGFAVATAMSTQYDSTFGNFSQYLTLFVWAAGAGTGGNLFKQLGASSAPGGQPDTSLPTALGGPAAGGAPR